MSKYNGLVGQLVSIHNGLFQYRVGRLAVSEWSESGYMVIFYNGTLLLLDNRTHFSKATEKEIRRFVLDSLINDGFSQAEVDKILGSSLS